MHTLRSIPLGIGVLNLSVDGKVCFLSNGHNPCSSFNWPLSFSDGDMRPVPVFAKNRIRASVHYSPGLISDCDYDPCGASNDSSGTRRLMIL